jgi:hypothetical protein
MQRNKPDVARRPERRSIPHLSRIDEVYASPEAFEPRWNGSSRKQAERGFESRKVSASGARGDPAE